jgi:hypothetical protein
MMTQKSSKAACSLCEVIGEVVHPPVLKIPTDEMAEPWTEFGKKMYPRN